MRLATTSLLLLSCCATPDEVAADRRETIREAQPVIEGAVLGKITARLEEKWDHLGTAIEDGDDAVRKETEEAFHTLADRLVEADSVNSRQHTLLRDALDRQRTEAAAERKATKTALDTLAGSVEGNNKALHAAEGVVRGMLFQALGQLNQTTALAKDNERKLSLSDEAKAIQRDQDLRSLREANAAQQEAHFAKLEASFWDFVQKMASTAGILAAILGALVTILYLWKKKGKASE